VDRLTPGAEPDADIASDGTPPKRPNIERGKAGKDGKDGEDGPRGKKGEQGKEGKQGKPVKDGQPGERGEPGPAGLAGSAVFGGSANAISLEVLKEMHRHQEAKKLGDVVQSHAAPAPALTGMAAMFTPENIEILKTLKSLFS
jgi:hypothetical protein